MRAHFEVIGSGVFLGHRYIYIIDLDGPVSVTNDAEAVVEYLLVQFPNTRIAYRDTMGNWDELDHDGRKFTGFKPFQQTNRNH